jgi:hypothetical protein
MTKKQVNLCEKLKRMGFAHENQLKLYGEVFELLSDPIVVEDELVLVDAIEKRSGQLRRVRIPLPIVNMASRGRTAA